MATYMITFKSEKSKGGGSTTVGIQANSEAEAKAKFNAPAKHVTIISIYKK